VLNWRGLFTEAEPPLRRDLEASERTLGVGHPHTLTSVSYLALCLKDMGNLDAAEPLLRRDLEASVRTQQCPQALHLLCAMQHHGVVPEVFTHSPAISAGEESQQCQ